MRKLTLKILKSPLLIKNNSAFTLIEMVLIIGILSVLTGLGILSIQAISLRAAQTDLYEMQSELRYLRKLAIEERKITSFKLDENQYHVHIDNTLEKSKEYHGQLQLESTTCQGEIIFSPTGKPQRAGTMIFSYGKHRKKLVVQPVNGRITIQEMSDEKRI